ncbi:hypothetical protein GOP47_0019305, partial [Adiantum capillus-veneris]
ESVLQTPRGLRLKGLHKQSLTNLRVRCHYTETGETPSPRPRARAPGHQSSCLHSGGQCLHPAGSPLAVGLSKCGGHELFHHCTGVGRGVADNALSLAGLGLQAIELHPHYYRIFWCASSRPATQWGLLFDSIGRTLDWAALIIQVQVREAYSNVVPGLSQTAPPQAHAFRQSHRGGCAQLNIRALSGMLETHVSPARGYVDSTSLQGLKQKQSPLGLPLLLFSRSFPAPCGVLCFA